MRSGENKRKPVYGAEQKDQPEKNPRDRVEKHAFYIIEKDTAQQKLERVFKLGE
mgnify:CR=1 FL=1